LCAVVSTGPSGDRTSPALGRAVLDALLEDKWVTRRRDTRALRVTPSGAELLGELLGDWKPAET
jgi:hypothetical protein